MGFGKAGLVGPSAEGQLDPPASLRNQSRYGASALLLAPGHFPPPKPAGALVSIISSVPSVFPPRSVLHVIPGLSVRASPPGGF